jgi:hypothetical protein
MKKGLLLGAGFSYDLGMPLVAELTPVFLEMFNKRAVQGFADLFMNRMQQYGGNRPVNKKAVDTGLALLVTARKNKDLNYERILAKLQKMEGIKNPTQSDRDSYHQLYGFLYNVIHELLCLYQNASYEILYPQNREWFSDFEGLLSDSETWVFNLNHDLTVECLALDFRIPITYGNTGCLKFPVSNLEMGKHIEFGTHEPKHMLTQNTFFHEKKGINLLKLHGGISERYYKDKALCCNLMLNKQSSKELMDEFSLGQRMGYHGAGGLKVPTGESERIVTNMAGELDILSSSLLTGDNKFSKTSNPKPGEERLQLFDKVLLGIDELTIIGYSFGDKHINNRISNALLLNPGLCLRIVNPSYVGPPECVEQFDFNDKVRGAYCGAAPWMHYNKHQKWNVAQFEALKNADREAVKKRVYELKNKI